MAGKIIADTIEASGSQISLNVGNVTVLTASSAGLTLTPTSNVNINITSGSASFTTANITTANITTANITGNLLVGTTTAQTGAKLSVTGGIQGTITSGTAVASTSGTSIDFTSIPSWVKRITVMLNGVSTNGSSRVLVRLGDSGGIETSGYVDNASTTVSSATGGEQPTNGFNLRTSDNSGIARHGVIVITLLNASTYTWMATSIMGSTSNEVAYEAGYKSLSDTLDRVRVTTANGTDTFDAGTINILYEG